MRHYLVQLFRYFHLVRFQAYASLKNEIARTYLGVVWWLLEPTLSALIFYFVFGFILPGRQPNFFPFLLIGTFTWQWFATSVSLGSGSIVARANLMQQVYLPKVIFPLISVVSGTWKFLFAFVVLLIFLWFRELPPSAAYLALPLVLAVQFLFNLSVAILASAWIPYFRDGTTVINTFLLLGGFTSGVFFSPKAVPAEYAAWVNHNPMTIVITAFRDILLEGHLPEFAALFWVTGVSVGLLIAGFLILWKLDLALPKVSF